MSDFEKGGVGSLMRGEQVVPINSPHTQKLIAVCKSTIHKKIAEMLTVLRNLKGFLDQKSWERQPELARKTIPVHIKKIQQIQKGLHPNSDLNKG